MKFGTTVWYGRRPLGPTFEAIHRLGFDYVEFSLDHPWPEGLSEKETDLLRTLEKEYDLKLAFHAPWAGLNLSHPRDELSTASLRVFERCLSFAGRFNPLYFNFHQSTRASTFHFEEIQRRIMKRALTSTSTIVEIGKKHGFRVTIENNPTIFFGIPDHLKLALKVKDLKMCLDVGHVYVANWRIQKEETLGSRQEGHELEDWFSLFKERTLTVHLHDCRIKYNSEPWDHLVLGRGSLDLDEIKRMIKGIDCGYVLLETYFSDERGTLATWEEIGENLAMCRNSLEGY
ncbi:MAG: TIM barrel protein [Nitrososphaeria archaeon]|nr:TIM barrel protein [Nitrososphaeria archaeon]NIN51888.1 TIM barrel protein [Nitrososphaeria archaeon]NIQ32436.1 TIM barrel protein [Nitrososphaeria archaeon]